MKNQEIKERFMNNYSDSSKDSIKELFELCSDFEDQNNKDIFEFTVLDMKNLLSYLKNVDNPMDSVWAITTLKNYINFAIENCYTTNTINKLNLL